MNRGRVALVGAGPGDVGLITVRGRDLLAQCDCVVYDYLANPALLAHCPPHAARIYVGKVAGQHHRTQDEILAILLEQAKQHKLVVRLKGGDPLLFGRGAEEAMVLQAHGIAYEIVPGVTAGLAAACYAGIPLTHRDLASAVTFLTGREKPGKAQSDHDWQALARSGTLVCYMGVSRLPEIAHKLLAAGKNPETPAAIIEWGTYDKQRVVTAPLVQLPTAALEAGIGNPAVVVIGPVVNCREHMAWYDQRPLFSRSVLVTRAAEQGGELAQMLREQGARVLHWPLGTFIPTPDMGPLDTALSTLAHHDWLAFTSANTVRFTWERLRTRGLDARAFAPARVAAVGQATAEALRSHGIEPDLVPETYDAEHLAAALRARGAQRVIIPQADNARPTLANALRASGMQVLAVEAYRSIALPLPPVDLEAERIDCVTFASSATVLRFVEQVTAPGVRRLVDNGCRMVAIGETTAATMAEAGVPLARMAQRATLPSLVAAVIAACTEPKP